MEIKGRIIQVLPLQQGTSKAGNPWKKQEYVLETQDNYPRKVKFDFFGDRADQYRLNVGDDVVVSFDLESREFNGRWYTDVRAWKSESAAAAAQQSASSQQAIGAEPAAPFGIGAQDVPTFNGIPAANETDDLPF